LGGPFPPAQFTSPFTRRTNEGHAKQTKNPTSAFTTGQSTLSFFILAMALPLQTSGRIVDDGRIKT
jgi:hypothetical protein